MSKSLKSISDEELYRLIKNDDRAAYAELYHRFRRPLLAYALKKISADDAEDIVQDLLTKLWDSRDSITVQKQFASYVFGALRNRIIDSMMRSTRIEGYLESIKVYALESRQEDGADYKMRESNFLDSIEKTLYQFSSKAHLIVRLRIEGYNNHEIAEKLNLSEKTIRNQHSEIIKFLRKKLPIILLLATFQYFLTILVV